MAAKVINYIQIAIRIMINTFIRFCNNYLTTLFDMLKALNSIDLGNRTCDRVFFFFFFNKWIITL